MQPPYLGATVIYRSRTGDYDVPAIVTATQKTLNRKGVEAGHVPDLSASGHVHLTVLTPGKPGMRRGAENFLVTSDEPVSENVAGTYQEWDIPPSMGTVFPDEGVRPGTWRWPEIP